MLHALIIDDNLNNIEVLEMLLEQHDVSCATVQTVRHVEKTVTELELVDVIFVDLEFPQGNGFQVLTTLRRFEKLKGVPIIAYSVHTSEIDQARLAGFDGFLGKPLQAKKFPSQLKRILSGGAVWDV